ncbi:hypothetical protein P2G88_04550 [Aliiglaciecola sp. CAU 1673]|uniref:hypothetical protein n=1 Tax=Aliiglaciecola sp. CAU 1673 TaxID=3032595 RepID=UPI0023DAE3F7|nr:hypothetical protein [Aliiglaciecola sp. CAU 1673]MDF2177516.1 hypothetical protein [Aliiglaciecola sp. CAU 1673]
MKASSVIMILLLLLLIDGAALIGPLLGTTKELALPEPVHSGTDSKSQADYQFKRQDIFADREPEDTAKTVEAAVPEMIGKAAIRFEQNEVTLLAVSSAGQDHYATFSASTLGQAAKLGDIVHVRAGEKILGATLIRIEGRRVVVEVSGDEYTLALFDIDKEQLKNESES